MNMKWAFVLTCVFVLSSYETVEAKRKNRQEVNPVFEEIEKPSESFLIDEKSSDADIVRAVNDQRRVDFVEGGSMVVVKVLPDDNQGLAHQKWTVRLSNGKNMQAVYNSDMCPRVPVKVGDVIAMGGQFIWTNKGGLLHWLHHDPRGKRPDGYVYVNGKFYCKD
ncbi:DUF3465 domain-containing protein [Bdellovibrio bacteriovorus]|nr:DUF3465 domain-containing protein [Bdellovibrio bacteriovorus]